MRLRHLIGLLVVRRDHRLTYSAVEEQATRLANVLIAHGLGIRRERSELADWESGQDTVGLYLLNSPEYLIGSLVAARRARARLGAAKTTILNLVWGLVSARDA